MHTLRTVAVKLREFCAIDRALPGLGVHRLKQPLGRVMQPLAVFQHFRTPCLVSLRLLVQPPPLFTIPLSGIVVETPHQSASNA